mgnify:FL=1
MAELTPKQARFVDEYLIDLNATKAAIRAGFSEKSASRQAVELLNKTHVRDAIEVRRTDRSEKTQINAAWLLERLAAEATADINDIYGSDGELLPVKDWPLIWRQGLVTGIDAEEIEVNGVRVGIVRKIRQSDRLRRLELIGKHIGVKAFEEQVSIKGLDTLADRLARAAQRNG